MVERTYLDVGGVRLCRVGFGGAGPPALLLHGLCGRGTEWHETAAWLSETHAVFALDQRGHGRSAKGLADYGRAAFVADAIAAIEGLERGPVLLVGQSLGGIHAMLAAAQRPELVRALVVIEAQAWNPVDRAAGPGPWLRRWPVPFASLADARAFFVSQRLRGDVWIEFLEEHDDGYRPQFAVDEMIAALGELGGPFDYRAAWERIACPVLVVGGAASTLDKAVLRAMADAVPDGRYAEIANAYHDVHLDQPAAFRAAVETFLGTAARGPAR